MHLVYKMLIKYSEKGKMFLNIFRNRKTTTVGLNKNPATYVAIGVGTTSGRITAKPNIKLTALQNGK